MGKMTVGVIGAGAISNIYIQNMKAMFDNLRVKSVCARHFEHAEAKAKEHDLSACTLEEMLADPEVELVVVLTPVDTHYEIIRAALLAGKHVYTEKTVTETAGQAAELFALARKKERYLGCAPDTFLGAGWQAARKALDEGVIGELNSFSIAINRNNDLLTSFFSFLCLPGAGALRDYQVYYLTALISLLGPVEKVCALIRTPYPKRTGILPGTKVYGKEYETPNESIISAVFEMKNGVTGTIHQDNESVAADRADFVLYGTKGMLLLGDANTFGPQIRILRTSQNLSTAEEILPLTSPYSDNSRGLGVSEMADAIFTGRKNRASIDLACHVLDVIEAMEKSAEEGAFVTLTSSCDRPAPLPT